MKFIFMKKIHILVATGVFQSYITTNIDQLLQFDFEIHVIIDNNFYDYMKKYKHLVHLVDASKLHTDFDNKSKLDKNFRNGFWHNASKRMFILNEDLLIR